MAGKSPSGSAPEQRELVGVAHAGGLDLDEDLAGAGSVEGDGLDGQGLVGLVGDGGSGLHGGRSVGVGALSLPALADRPVRARLSRFPRDVIPRLPGPLRVLRRVAAPCLAQQPTVSFLDRLL